MVLCSRFSSLFVTFTIHEDNSYFGVEVEGKEQTSRKHSLETRRHCKESRELGDCNYFSICHFITSLSYLGSCVRAEGIRGSK